MELPSAIAYVFQDGGLLLRPEWRPFDNVLLNAPATMAIYALGLPRGIRYDKGTSCIAYIGSAVNLQRRISQHVGHYHNSHIWELKQAFGELWVAYWLLPSMDHKWLLTMEGEAICRFERQYGTVPVCNQSIQSTPYAKLLRDMVAIPECQTENPVPLAELETITGFKVKRRFRPPLLKHSITANQWFYEGVEWPTKEQEAERLAKEFAEADRKIRLEHLTIVDQQRVMAWSVSKMQALVRLTQSLTPDSRPSSVVRFQARSRDVPRPHSWGEVALVKARIVAGAWMPEKRLWLKILHGKEPLGQAMLESYHFRGEDKSDLSQREDLPERADSVDVAQIESRFQEALRLESQPA
jgi:hypothetical protein